MSEPTYTKEQLRNSARDGWNLAIFALAQMERAENAEAERDEANDERDDAVDRWARRAREAEATCKELLQVQAERDRLRAQLDSILANSDSLESGKLADANAEIARLREKLRAWQEKSDRHESERDSFRLEADRLREKGAWLQAEVDVLRGKACDEEQAAGNGPCGVCRNCAWAERDRLREELLGAKVAWDMCDAVNGRLREGLREATALLSDAATEMEASGGWDGDEDLFDRIMTYLRTRERKEKEE